jgi:hypothetical protein
VQKEMTCACAQVFFCPPCHLHMGSVSFAVGSQLS